MAKLDIFSDEFDQTVAAAWKHEREESLRFGLAVFSTDYVTGLNMMEQNGRKFEIRWIPGQPRDRNYEILREIGKSEAA